MVGGTIMKSQVTSMLLCCCFAILCAFGCRSVVEDLLLTDDQSAALDYLRIIKHDGSLPGISPDAGAKFRLGQTAADTLTYPRSIHVWSLVASEKDAVYSYVLTMDSKESGWRIVRAWKNINKKTVWHMDEADLRERQP